MVAKQSLIVISAMPFPGLSSQDNASLSASETAHEKVTSRELVALISAEKLLMLGVLFCWTGGGLGMEFPPPPQPTSINATVVRVSCNNILDWLI